MTSDRFAAIGTFVLLAASPAATAQADAQKAVDQDIVQWSDVEVPGTPQAFARAAELDESLDPQFLLLEWVRARDLPGADGTQRWKHIQPYLAAIEQFRSLRTLLGPEVSLSVSGKDRKRLDALLDTIGLDLAIRNGMPRVTVTKEKAKIEQRELLATAGLALDGIDLRLNRGESVSLTLPSFRALLPSSPEWWRTAVFGSSIPPEALYLRIIDDADTGFLYYGLTATDLETRRFIQLKPKILQLAKERPVLFAICAGHFRVRGGHVEVPGGTPAQMYWEGLVDQEVRNPERFFEELLTRDVGRLAHFYSFMAALDEPHLRFALGMNETRKGQSPRSSMRTLYDVWFQAVNQWRFDQHPFVMPDVDPGLFIAQVAVDTTGNLLGPASQQLWRAVFESTDIPQELSVKTRATTTTAAELIELVFRSSQDTPSNRMQMVLFAGRVFNGSSESEAANIVIALRGFRRFPMLQLTLERIGIRPAAIYAAASRRAASLAEIRNPDTLWTTLSQFQGALALIERSVFSRRLSRSAATGLVASLVALEPDGDGLYGSRLALWLADECVPAIAGDVIEDSAPPLERSLLAGMSGVGARSNATTDTAPLMEWEGWRYRVAPSVAAFARMTRIREVQAGNSLDAVLSLARAAVALTSATTVEQVRVQSGILRDLQRGLREPRPHERLTDDKTLTGTQAITEAIRELERIRTDKQARSAPGTARQFLDPLSATLAADVLRALVYASTIAATDTTLLAGGDISHLHDFGLGIFNAQERAQVSWSRPVRLPGQTSKVRVRGSLLGLDLAFSALVLGRVAVDTVPVVSLWSDPSKQAFEDSLALFNPFDAGINKVAQVADAIRRGRDAVERLASTPERLDALAAQARLGPLRRALVQHSLTGSPSSVTSLFTMMEFLRLGADTESLEAAKAWGAATTSLDGCLCLAVPPALDWDAFGARETSLLGTESSLELLLRLAEFSVDVKLPPALISDVLAFSMRAVLDQSQVKHDNDWFAVVRYVASMRQRAIEDFVSRTTTGWSLVAVGAAD